MHTTLTHFIYKRLPRPCFADAEDVLQETYLALLKAGLPFDRPLLFNIARRRIVDFKRTVCRKKRDVRRKVRLIDVAAPVKEKLDLEPLSPVQRQVVELRLAKSPLKDVAEMLGLPMSTACHHWREAKKTLSVEVTAEK